MIVLSMVIYAILGYVGHQTRDYVTGHMSRDWQDVSNRTMGVLYVFPLALLMFRQLKDDIGNDETRFTTAYFLSFLSFGVGVAIGYRYKASNRIDEGK